MRIVKYSIHLDSDKKGILVKEESKNCPEYNTLNSPKKICDVFNQVFHASQRAEEYVWLMALDVKCKPIGFFEISHGTVNSSLITPREVFVRLCLCSAASFVLVHNHPSGDPLPSKEDMEVTKRMKETGKMMGISLLDHIIIGAEGFYSFTSNR